MRAVVCSQHAGPEALEIQDLPEPPLGKGAVRVRVHACGVNFPDTLIIQGLYQFKPPLPFTPGAELAGEVVEVSDGVTDLKPGDRVMAVLTHGAYAEQVVLPANAVIPVPDGMDFETAAVFPMAYGTSYHALKQRGTLAAGETLLVLGAAGGVGLAAVELGARMGARVIAAVGSDDKMEVCRAHGAAEVINYRTGSLKEQVKALTGGQGADVIYDPVGGEIFDQAVSCLAWRGRLLVVGFASGTIPQLPINKVLLKGAALVGVFWGAFAMREARLNQQNFAELGQWYAQGKLKPHVGGRYTLEQVPQAMTDMLARKAIGKYVVTLQK